MEIIRHSNSDAARFDKEWRAALRARSFQRRRLADADLPLWRDRARIVLSFAHDGGNTSGTITFQDGEPVPHPADLCELLKLDAVWFFGHSYACAVHTGHDGWELAEVFEPVTDVDV